MIGKIDPRAYDCEGRVPPVLWKRPRPSKRFLSSLVGGGLTVKCGSLDEVRAFLRGCRYVSDSEQFGVRDYWLHPRFFERLRRGDCEDFALWTWRQLLAMGLDARFVLGKCGLGDRANRANRVNHAWVTFSDSQAHYLLEPTSPRRRKLSRLEILLYKPSQSVSLREGELVWHDHEPRYHRWTTSEFFMTFVRVPVLLFFDLPRLPWHLVKGIAGRMKARKGDRWQEIVVTVNDKLPGSEELICRLLDSGIPVSEGEDLGSRPMKPLAQRKRLVTFGRGLPPERIRDVLRAAGDCVDFVQITNEFVALVYLGAYWITGPEAELTPELRAALLRSNLSTADLWATITAHDYQKNRHRRS